VTQHISISGRLRDHESRGAKNQSADSVSLHSRNDRSNQSTLGVARQVQICISLSTDMVDHRHGVGNPLKQGVFPELTAAFAVPVQIKAQRSQSGFPHGGCRQNIVRSVFCAGKPVKLDDQRRMCQPCRFLQHCAQLNAIILNDDNRGTWQRFFEMKKSDGRPIADVAIVNYEGLRKFFVARIKREGRFTLKSVEFDKRKDLFRTIIIDESHKCKNVQTQQSKFVQGIAAGKEYILELTGTPVVNNNEDLVQQLRIMGRLDDFGGYGKFMQR
jgi:hypothetical protein